MVCPTCMYFLMCILICLFVSAGNSVLEETSKNWCCIWIWSLISFGCWNEPIPSYRGSTAAGFNGCISTVLRWHGSVEQFLQ